MVPLEGPCNCGVTFKEGLNKMKTEKGRKSHFYESVVYTTNAKCADIDTWVGKYICSDFLTGKGAMYSTFSFM